MAEAVAQEDGDAPAAERMERPGRQGGPGMRRAGPAARGEMRTGMRALGLDRAIGRLMDRQHELEISDDQMRELAALRDEARSRLAPMREVMEETRTGMRDGSLTREAARTRMQSIHEGLNEAGQELRDRLEEILEPEQRAALRRGAMRHAAPRGEQPGSRRRR